MAKVLQEYKMMTVITKSTTIEQWREAVGSGVRLQSVSVCTGTNVMWDKEAQDWKTMQEVLRSFPDIKMITIDVANAYHQNMVDFIAKVRDQYPTKIIVAGNVVTPEMTEELIINGADVVKIGIGPGSVCTTRTMTGVGVPQFSAILEVCNSVDNKVPVIADGGIKYTGDIAKAIAAGASCVMLGSLLAGTKESPGETIIYEGRKFKSYRGMGSLEAMKKGSKDRYFQDVESDIKKLVPEGIVGRVPYKGCLLYTSPSPRD